MPEFAFDAHSHGSGAIDIRECPAFIVTITPAEPHESSDILDDLLFGIESETVFGSVSARGLNVGRTCGAIQSAFIAAHARAIQEGEEPDRAWMIHNCIPSL